jgi:H+-transporting ATPase
LFADIPRLQTFTFEMLIYVELLDVLIIRERRHFWYSRPSNFLLLAVIADLLLVLFIALRGLPGIAPIDPRAALAIPPITLILVFLINDPVKTFLVKKFWAT